MSNNVNFLAKNQIKITQVDDPHKFYYKNCNDAAQNLLLEDLEECIAHYVEDLFEWDEQLLPINHGDVIAAHHPEWKKWIRGKAGKIVKCEETGQTSIYIWAIDYGCKMLLPLKKVILLSDLLLAHRHPINVHIGGLSDVLPAKAEFNCDTFETEIIKTKTWSPKAIEMFTEWISDQKMFITFEVTTVESERSFGRLMLHFDETNNNNVFCIAQELCEMNEAIQDRHYLNEVRVLDREDFLRLNHEMACWSNDEIDVDDNIERVWMNDEPLSSIDVQLESASNQEVSSLYRQQSHSGSQIHSGTNSLSTVSLTLSVKSLNKLNLLVVTEDDVVPAKEWQDTFYFSDQIRQCLQKVFPKGIEAQCAYGWPHIMRTNSLLLIGETVPNIMLCLPTVCSTAYRAVSDWSTSLRIEPIVIILVATAEDVEHMARLCRKFLAKSSISKVNVFCLNSTFEMDTLLNTNNIDILVTSIFCFQAVTVHMEKLFRSQRLRYIWFHQIDEMCQINASITSKAVSDILSSETIDIQIITTSKTYSPILRDLFDQVKIPMLSIGKRSPFEAALFAKCCFVADLVSSESKINNLIEILLDSRTKMTGPIVIVCANKMDVKYVIGSLTQSNIKCIEFDEHYSWNQMKLVKWSNQCLSLQNRPSNKQSSNINILVSDDENLNIFPVRTASHIIHYTLPNKLETFMQRHITCFASYENRIRRELVHKENEYDSNRPISLVYFDDNLSEEYIQIYQLLSNRTDCELPPYLTNTVDKLWRSYERTKKNKPLCSELITKAKDCGMDCPYRHLLTDPNDTLVPEYGFVNMDLLEVIAPNHFAVRVTGHKRCKAYKTKPIEYMDEEWVQFDQSLCEHYSTGQRKKLHSIDIGDMCLIFHRNQPKRCRIISKSKKRVCVYLIDIGRVRHYNDDDLYHLDEIFQEFLPKAIEIFVLGFAPCDNSKWLPEVKQCVVRLMDSIKHMRETNNYLQAEVIRAFERTLIVKDLRIMFKGEKQLHYKAIAQELNKYGFADKTPIVLHDIFMVSDDDDSKMSVNSEMQDDTVIDGEKLHKLCALLPAQISSSIYFERLCVTPQEYGNIMSERVSTYSASLAHDMANEPMAPANSAASSNGTIGKADDHEFDGEREMTNSVSLSWDNFITENIQMPVSATPSWDEIFGSLPDNIQAMEVLSPTKCYQSKTCDDVDAVQEPSSENVDWLIDFSDDNSNEANILIPSPFANVRVINSIDDLL